MRAQLFLSKLIKIIVIFSSLLTLTQMEVSQALAWQEVRAREKKKANHIVLV